MVCLAQAGVSGCPFAESHYQHHHSGNRQIYRDKPLHVHGGKLEASGLQTIMHTFSTISAVTGHPDIPWKFLQFKY